MRIATLALLATVLVSGSVEQGRRQEFVRQLGAETAGEYQRCILAGLTTFVRFESFLWNFGRRVVHIYTDGCQCLVYAAPITYVSMADRDFTPYNCHISANFTVTEAGETDSMSCRISQSLPTTILEWHLCRIQSGAEIQCIR